MLRLKGVDAALYQGDIDWVQAHNAGIYFAMIKSSQGCSVKEPAGNYNPFVDPKFKKNIVNAYNAGIRCGVYHYLTCTTIEQANTEADYLLSVIAPYKDKITFPVAIDIEESRYQKKSLKPLNTQIVRVVADKIRAAGYIPVVYSSRYFLNTFLNLKALSDLDVWLAVYFSPRRIEPAPVFERMTMWQWTSSGVSVPGIPGNVDCNFVYKNYAEPVMGDLNGDGVIDSLDALLEKKYLVGNIQLTEEQLKLADLNGDGDVDTTDYLLLRRKIVSAK